MGIFSKKTQNTAGQVDMSRLPRHIAIIMDGNGRWAKMRGLPRTAGHKVGAETFRRIAKHCKKLGIQYLTVYAFSTENWKRPKEEAGEQAGQHHPASADPEAGEDHCRSGLVLADRRGLRQGPLFLVPQPHYQSGRGGSDRVSAQGVRHR